MKILVVILYIVILFFFLVKCDDSSSKLAQTSKELTRTKCLSCHSYNFELTGPSFRFTRNLTYEETENLLREKFLQTQRDSNHINVKVNERDIILISKDISKLYSHK